MDVVDYVDVVQGDVVNTKRDMRLCLLPNLDANIRSNAFPHEISKDTDVCIVAYSVKTNVRVGLMLPNEWYNQNCQIDQHEKVKLLRDGSHMEVAMTFHKDDAAQTEITGGVPGPWQDGAQSTTQFLSIQKPEPGSESSSDDGKARKDCVAEVTFSFRFTTVGSFIPDSNTTTRFFLRFSELRLGMHVDTEPFRLVTRKDKTRIETGEPVMPERPRWGPKLMLPLVGFDEHVNTIQKLLEVVNQLTAAQNIYVPVPAIQSALYEVNQAIISLQTVHQAAGPLVPMTQE